MHLSEMSKISISCISKTESPSCNKNIYVVILNHIANVLNINSTEFFDGRVKYPDKVIK